MNTVYRVAILEDVVQSEGRDGSLSRWKIKSEEIESEMDARYAAEGFVSSGICHQAIVLRYIRTVRVLPCYLVCEDQVNGFCDLPCSIAARDALKSDIQTELLEHSLTADIPY